MQKYFNDILCIRSRTQVQEWRLQEVQCRIWASWFYVGITAYQERHQRFRILRQGSGGLPGCAICDGWLSICRCHTGKIRSGWSEYIYLRINDLLSVQITYVVILLSSVQTVFTEKKFVPSQFPVKQIFIICILRWFLWIVYIYILEACLIRAYNDA